MNIFALIFNLSKPFIAISIAFFGLSLLSQNLMLIFLEGISKFVKKKDKILKEMYLKRKIIENSSLPFLA